MAKLILLASALLASSFSAAGALRINTEKFAAPPQLAAKAASLSGRSRSSPTIRRVIRNVGPDAAVGCPTPSQCYLGTKEAMFMFNPSSTADQPVSSLTPVTTPVVTNATYPLNVDTIAVHGPRGFGAALVRPQKDEIGSVAIPPLFLNTNTSFAVSSVPENVRLTDFGGVRIAASDDGMNVFAFYWINALFSVDGGRSYSYVPIAENLRPIKRRTPSMEAPLAAIVSKDVWYLQVWDTDSFVQWIVKTVDGGKTFADVYRVPGGSDSNYWVYASQGLACANADTCFVASCNYNPASTCTIAATVDGGKTWVDRWVSQPREYGGVRYLTVAPSGFVAFAVGSLILYSRDLGVTWTTVDVDAHDGQYRGPQTLTVLGESHMIVTTHLKNADGQLEYDVYQLNGLQ